MFGFIQTTFALAQHEGTSFNDALENLTEYFQELENSIGVIHNVMLHFYGCYVAGQDWA